MIDSVFATRPPSLRRSLLSVFLLAGFLPLAFATTAAADCAAPPPPIAHGFYIEDCSNRPDGMMCIADCDDGYSWTGEDWTCFGTNWGHTGSGPPVCYPSSCTASPSNPSGGSYPNCSGQLIGHPCSLTCNPGYTKVGANPTCVEGTTWNGSPSCQPNSCGAPAPTPHGSYACSTVPHGQTCPLNCESGFEKSGVEQTCTLGAYSGPPPSCQESHCTAGPMSPANGSYESCTTTPIGNPCSLTCNPGYTKVGANPTCVEGTTWNGSPSCEPNSCGAPAPTAHGSYACSTVPHGQTCSLSCDSGYAKSGVEQTCTLGAYSGPSPSCEASHCTAAPMNPANGTYEPCATTPIGNTCSLSCNPGYTRTGANPTCVEESTWNGSPSCEPNSCGAPAPVANGSYASCSTVPHGQTCSLSCDSGFSKVGSEQSCQLGLYSGPAPSCVPDATTTSTITTTTSTIDTSTSTTTTTTLVPGCAPLPATGCHQVEQGVSLALAKSGTKDLFKWKWAKGAATDLASFADPTDAMGDYRLCLYDASALAQPLAELAVASGSSCDGAPCWSAKGTTGFQYKDAAGASGNVQSITLKAPTPAKASLLVKAGGPGPWLPTLPIVPPLVIQFVATDGSGSSACWQGVYATPAKNTESLLKVKVP